MAVYIQKVWNPGPALIANGVSISLGGNKTYLHVLDEAGNEIARFRTNTVKHYWIQNGDESSLLGPIIP